MQRQAEKLSKLDIYIYIASKYESKYVSKYVYTYTTKQKGNEYQWSIVFGCAFSCNSISVSLLETAAGWGNQTHLVTTAQLWKKGK